MDGGGQLHPAGGAAPFRRIPSPDAAIRHDAARRNGKVGDADR
jgi:hypothetical protein